jgi:protocatechuate 3,4-dioxygenase, alpha subunit
MMTDASDKPVRPAGITPSQTVGPYFHFGLTSHAYPFRQVFDGAMAGPGVAGEHITISGRVFDGAGEVVKDVMIELWQADAKGQFDHAKGQRNAGFTGFGRSDCDETGRFQFSTVKPGTVAAPDGTIQAPHIVVNVFGRGMPRQLVTRIYFPQDRASHVNDAVLKLVPVARRATLVAEHGPGGSGTVYSFDIHLQGARETVFFDV